MEVELWNAQELCCPPNFLIFGPPRISGMHVDAPVGWNVGALSMKCRSHFAQDSENDAAEVRGNVTGSVLVELRWDEMRRV